MTTVTYSCCDDVCCISSAARQNKLKSVYTFPIMSQSFDSKDSPDGNFGRGNGPEKIKIAGIKIEVRKCVVKVAPNPDLPFRVNPARVPDTTNTTSANFRIILRRYSWN